MKADNREIFTSPRSPARIGADVPDRVGVGFKAQHAQDVLGRQSDLGWFEVHPENYMVAGGPRHTILESLRGMYPLSLHGVGLSLAGAERPDRDHLRALRSLIDRYQPGLVSEHIAWSAHDGVFLADLLPAPLAKATLDQLCINIDETQDALGRRILIENPAQYFLFPGSDIPEPEFIVEAARRTGCGLLVDVNNIFVSAVNLGFDAKDYIDALPPELIGEIHLAGHSVDQVNKRTMLIDNHVGPVSPEVWDLFRRLIRRTGPKPTLIEWDNDIPEWPVLYREAKLAEAALLGQSVPEVIMA